MADEKIIERIKKLLELSGSDNKHEAEAAAAKAADLMMRHNLEEGDLESKKYTDMVLTEGLESKTHLYICTILNEFFNVQTVRRKRWRQDMLEQQLAIVGEPTNVKVAKYMFDYLERQFQTLCDQFSTQEAMSLDAQMASFEDSFLPFFGADTKRVESYAAGLFEGLMSKLKEAQKNVEQETGLMVVKDGELMRHLKEDLGMEHEQDDLRMTVDPVSLMRGREDGQKINISQGLETAGTSRRLT